MSKCRQCKFYDYDNEQMCFTNYHYAECSKLKQDFITNGLPTTDYSVYATEPSCCLFEKAVDRKVRFSGEKAPVIIAMLEGKSRDYIVQTFGVSPSLYYKIKKGKLWEDDFKKIEAAYNRS